MPSIKVLALEFIEGGNTLWIHGEQGTMLRLKTTGVITSKSCGTPSAHVDIMVDGDIQICLPDEPDDD